MEPYLSIENIFCGEDGQYSFLSKPGNEDYAPFNGSTFALEKRRYRYFNVSLCHTFELDATFKREKGETAYHPECLHLIFQLALCVANIQDGSVPSRLNAAVFLDCLEYLPAIVTIAYISC